MYYYQEYYPYDYYSTQQATSHIRILHASPDAPAVDVYINNNKIVSNLEYRNFTEYMPVYAGRYDVKVFAAGTRTNPVIDTVINIPSNSIFTIAASGRLREIELLPIEEPKLSIPSGRLYVRFAHLSPNAPRVDVKLSSGRTLFTNVGFEAVANYLLINPGTYTFEIFIAGTNERVLYIPNITLKADRFYTIYAVGLAGESPPLQVLIPLDGNSYIR